MKQRIPQRGVTLVEIMVVIAILGVLIYMAFGSFTGGVANPTNVSEQVVSTMSFARMRATATRRVHRVVVEPNLMSVYQSPNTGLVAPASGWQLVQTTTINSRLKLWNAQAGALVSAGATPSQNTTLKYAIDFKPDGRAGGGACSAPPTTCTVVNVTGSTIFVTNVEQTSKYRVLVYGATGGSYARASW